MKLKTHIELHTLTSVQLETGQSLLMAGHSLSVCISLHPCGWAHSFVEVPGTHIGLRFIFRIFELKSIRKVNADANPKKFQHNIV